jgi:uncharacterized tellurite resistance protein B-like protein
MSMSKQVTHPPEAAAVVLALMVAADGRIDPRELQTLDALQAFERVGVRRERFVELADQCIDAFVPALGEYPLLRLSALAGVNTLLDRVDEPAQRLLVCRLAAAAITADGRISADERVVYNHMLGRWRISQSMVTQAILQDAVH